MKRKNLQHLSLDSPKPTDNSETASKNEEASGNNSVDPDLITGHFAAGFPPFLRGKESLGFIQKPWGNQRFYRIDRRYLKLSKSLETLLADKPIGKMSLLLQLDENLLFSVGLLMNAAEKRNLAKESVSFILEYELSEETKDVPHEFLLKQVKLVYEYARDHLPNFKGILIRYKVYDFDSIELTDQVALSFWQAKLFLDHLMDTGSSIDRLAPLLAFHWPIGSDFWAEIAKVRAARMLWTKLVNTYQPKNSEVMKLKLYAKILGSPIKEEEQLQSASTLQALSGVFGGVAHLDTIGGGLPKQEARLIDRFLQTEPQVTSPVDPWGGSFVLEKQTLDFAHKINKKFEKLVKSNDRESFKIPIESPFPILLEKIKKGATSQEIREYLLTI